MTAQSRAVLDCDGVTDRATRRAAAAGTALGAPLDGYLEKVRDAPHRVTDDDVAALVAGHREDVIFEVTVAAVLGRAVAGLEAALSALRTGLACGSTSWSAATAPARGSSCRPWPGRPMPRPTTSSRPQEAGRGARCPARPVFWTAAEREQMAVTVSQLNRCRFCADVHAATARFEAGPATGRAQVSDVSALLEAVTTAPAARDAGVPDADRGRAAPWP